MLNEDYHSDNNRINFLIETTTTKQNSYPHFKIDKLLTFASSNHHQIRSDQCWWWWLIFIRSFRSYFDSSLSSSGENHHLSKCFFFQSIHWWLWFIFFLMITTRTVWIKNIVKGFSPPNAKIQRHSTIEKIENPLSSSAWWSLNVNNVSMMITRIIIAHLNQFFYSNLVVFLKKVSCAVFFSLPNCV